MDIRNPAGLLDSLLYPNGRNTQTQEAPASATTAAAQKKQAAQQTNGKDIIVLSRQSQQSQPEQKPNASKFQVGDQPPPPPPRSNGLVSEETTTLENGYRRTQNFEREGGQSFTRLEEVTSSADRSKRIVIQQNSSGSTTALETILDRQSNGTFRLTQRYTNEVGETSTDIKFDVTTDNADVLLGRAQSPERAAPPPYQSPRGTQYDVVT